MIEKIKFLCNFFNHKYQAHVWIYDDYLHINVDSFYIPKTYYIKNKSLHSYSIHINKNSLKIIVSSMSFSK